MGSNRGPGPADGRRPTFPRAPNPCYLSRMTPEEFIDKWSRADRTERQAAQEHFIDLCRMLGEPAPNEAADPDGYSFAKGVSKLDGATARPHSSLGYKTPTAYAGSLTAPKGEH